MANTKQTSLDSNTQFDALVSRLADALVTRLGLSVPTTTPTIAAMPIQPTQPTTKTTAPRVTQPRAAKASADVPKHGDFYCKVNVHPEGHPKAGQLCARTKLPMGLFADGYSRVVLTLPTGSQIAVDKDGEGRARLAKGILQDIGAQAGQYLVFDREEDGYYLVSLVGHAQVAQPRPQQTSGIVPIQATPVVRVPVKQYREVPEDPFNLAGLFTSPQAQTQPTIAEMYSAPRENVPTQTQTQPKTANFEQRVLDALKTPAGIKRPRTAKQLENDRKLGEQARLRHANAQKATQAGTVASGTRAETSAVRVTPIFVTGTRTEPRKQAVQQIQALTGRTAIILPRRG